MDTAAGDDPPGDAGASGAGRDRALPGLSEAFHAGPIPAAESGRQSARALRAAAVMPVASPFDRRVIWVGGIVFAVLMALSARYGFDRDELYFLDGARHLQASYVDQPVLGPLLAWVSLKLFGVSLPGLRVWPALAAGATVVAGGLIAREFGGGKRAQLLAAIGTATMPVLLGSAHVANTAELPWPAGLACRPGHHRASTIAHTRIPHTSAPVSYRSSPGVSAARSTTGGAELRPPWGGDSVAGAPPLTRLAARLRASCGRASSRECPVLRLSKRNSRILSGEHRLPVGFPDG